MEKDNANQGAAAPRTAPICTRTDDGGYVVDFEEGDRDVSFVTPEDGSITYFAAYGPQGFRRAGIVRTMGAYGGLVRWAAGGPFPESGLEIGAPAAPKEPQP